MTEGITLSYAAVAWLTAGEHGISSETMFCYLAFGTGTQPWWRNRYPLDPDDFRRCELLLDAVPELRERLPRMAELGPEWAALVERWGELAALLAVEQPGYRGPDAGGSAPRCSALMHDVIRQGRGASTAPA
jgi:hypothetical protein